MIKVTVMYENKAGARFDHDYYRDVHMPLIKARLGESCRFYSIDRGISGPAPDSDPAFIGMCHIFSDSVEAFQKGFAPHAAEIQADVLNYTDITPLMLISQVVVGASVEAGPGPLS